MAAAVTKTPVLLVLFWQCKNVQPSGQSAYGTALKTYDILRHNLACIILAGDDNLLITFVQFDTLQVAWIVLFRQAACHNTLSAVVFAAPFLALRPALG